jgi:hypothetical protein
MVDHAMAIGRTKFNKTQHGRMSSRYIDHIDRMRRQRRRAVRRGPTSSKKSAAAQ